MMIATMTLSRMMANPTTKQSTFCESSKNYGITSSPLGMAVVLAAMAVIISAKRR
jgi:hypothetical protein